MSKKKVLITGGTRGIGKSVAELFAKEGYSVHITGTKKSDVPDYVDKLFIVNFDNIDEIKSFFDDIKNETYNVLVNNAGINIIKKIDDVTFDDWSSIHNTNLKTPYFLSKIVSQNMSKNDKIINVSSIFSSVSKEYRTLYSTTKFGINGLTKSLSIELGPKGILVNSVSPGFTNTELTDKSLSNEQKKELSSQIPLGRFAETEEISNLIYFLGSQMNSYITGQNIIIDGGFTAK